MTKLNKKFIKKLKIMTEILSKDTQKEFERLVRKDVK